MRPLQYGVYALLLSCLLVIAGCAATGDAVDGRQAAEANANLGADFLRKGDNEQALARFERALGYNDSNVSANWGMAIVNDRLGETARARRFYEKTVDLQPGPEILNSYAAFLCQQGEVDAAVKYFKRAANNPRYAGAGDALANAGLCLHRAGQPEVAERYYREALAANASQVTALANMARLQYEKSDFLRARAFIERADAVANLTAEQLLLGAHIELALDERGAAGRYLRRHNASDPGATLSLRQLEQSR